MDAKRKAKVCAELFRCAISGEFVTYTQFFNRIQPGKSTGNSPYQTHFNEIAKEERELPISPSWSGALGDFQIKSTSGMPGRAPTGTSSLAYKRALTRSSGSTALRARQIHICHDRRSPMPVTVARTSGNIGGLARLEPRSAAKRHWMGQVAVAGGRRNRLWARGWLTRKVIGVKPKPAFSGR
jgi:hypothetical protein